MMLYAFLAWKSSIKMELDLGSSSHTQTHSHSSSAHFIWSDLLSCAKAQQTKQHSSPPAILNTRLRHTGWAKPLCSDRKRQQGFSPMTNNDKWRHPDKATARVCRWNKDKHAQLEKCDVKQWWVHAENRILRRLSLFGCICRKLNILYCQGH